MPNCQGILDGSLIGGVFLNYNRLTTNQEVVSSNLAGRTTEKLMNATCRKIAQMESCSHLGKIGQITYAEYRVEVD